MTENNKVETANSTLEAAASSTLFLDELGELPLDLQAELLKAIEEQRIKRSKSNTARKIDVRLIFAANQPLEQLAASELLNKNNLLTE